MLTSDEIFHILKDEEIPKEEFIIISGAAMVIYGIKEKNDIDIAVSESLYNDLKLRKDCMVEKILEDTGETIYYLHKLNFGMNYYDTNYQYVNGYKVQTIEEIIKLKENLNRSKDKEDLKRLKEFINQKVI